MFDESEKLGFSNWKSQIQTWHGLSHLDLNSKQYFQLPISSSFTLLSFWLLINSCVWTDKQERKRKKITAHSKSFFSMQFPRAIRFFIQVGGKQVNKRIVYNAISLNMTSMQNHFYPVSQRFQREADAMGSNSKRNGDKVNKMATNNNQKAPSNIKCIAHLLTQKDNFLRNVATTQFTLRVTYYLPTNRPTDQPASPNQPTIRILWMFIFFFFLFRYFVFKRTKIKLSTWWVRWVAILAPGIFHTFLLQCLLLLLMDWHSFLAVIN